MVIYRKGDYNIGFTYIKNDKTIKDNKILDYIKSIKIPPAYKDVIINDNNNKKILAFGYDSKDRKQVIYNPEFVKKNNNKKYKRYLYLCKNINKLKKKINSDLNGNNEKNKEIAIVIFLILNCGFRIGNDIYLKNNNSYGITTLEKKHIKFVKPDKMIIEFNGKKNVLNKSICKSKIIYDYFKTKSNKLFDITSLDVNDYLRDFNITSKDLRTWNANELFNKYIKYNKVNQAIKMVAKKLHNTPSVCKKNYIFI